MLAHEAVRTYGSLALIITVCGFLWNSPVGSSDSPPDQSALRTDGGPDAKSAPEGLSARSGRGTQWLALPDEGPRYDRPVQGAGAEIFQAGVTAYARRDFKAAGEAFRQVASQHSDGALAEPARAFLAEILLAGPQTLQNQMQAILAYLAILHDFPSSPNQARNRWRVGDLYAAMNAYAEAQGMYEMALVDAPASADAERALLGLAVNFMEWGKWQEAEQQFELLRTRTSDEAMLRLATIGLADTLYAQRRLNQAQLLYEACYRRWPDFVKQHPRVLTKFAEVTMAIGQDPLARQLYGTLYNLYPRAADAPVALVQIGDSFRRAGSPDRARLLYADAVARHPHTLGETVARMRLAELSMEKVTTRKGVRLRMAVEELFLAGPAPRLDLMQEHKVFQSVADSYPNTVLGNEALFHLGERFESRKDWPQAIRIYRQVRSREGQVPDDPWPGKAGRRLSAILEPWILKAIGDQDDLAAITFFHQAGGSPEEVFAEGTVLLQVAAVHRRAGFTVEAIRLYQALAQNRSALSLREEALLGLGQCYLDQEDYTAARQVFERYRIQYPLGRWKAEALRWLALAYRALGDHAGAVRTSQRWLQSFPASAHPLRSDMLRLLAEELAEEGQTGEAFRAYEEAERAGALAAPAALIRYADFLTREKRYDDAVTRYRLALRAEPEAAQEEWVRFQLARIRRAQSYYADARSQLQELADVSEDDLVDRLSVSMRAALPKKGGS